RAPFPPTNPLHVPLACRDRGPGARRRRHRLSLERPPPTGSGGSGHRRALRDALARVLAFRARRDAPSRLRRAHAGRRGRTRPAVRIPPVRPRPALVAELQAWFGLPAVV